MSGIDIKKLAERLAELNSSSKGGGGMGFYNLGDGRNLVRILPSKDDGLFFQETWVHYGVGKTDTNTKGQMIVCPKTHGDENPCPVCELVDEYYRMSKKRGDKYSKLANEARKKKRVYYNVLPKDEDFSLEDYSVDAEGKWVNADGEEESPVQVMSTGVMILKQLLGIIVDPEYGDITHPTEGLDAIITKTGSGFDTTYETRTKRKSSPIGFDEWKECLNDLTVLSKPKSYEDIHSIMLGETPDGSNKGDEDDDEEDTVPKESNISADDDDIADDIKAAIERRRNAK